MSDPVIHPFILSGGAGKRLWPLSRELMPKQFHALTSDDSLFQDTCKRLGGDGFARPSVICNQAHQFFVRDHATALGIALDRLVLEPVARNTGPAAAFAAMVAQETAPDALVLLLPSDHAIPDDEAFRKTIRDAVPAAEAGRIVTFGIRPTQADTGYGYIHAGRRLEGLEPALAVKAFTEKPDMERATHYASRDDYFWNAGIFLFRADVFLNEFERFQPAMASACKSAFERAARTEDIIEPAREPLEECPALSVDYAVMEHTDKAAVVPASFRWSDVGNWTALSDLAPADASGTVSIGDVLAHDTKNSYLRTEGPLLSSMGVEDLIVVATGDAVLVAHKDRAQEVESFATELKRVGRTEHAAHRVVYRPWGWYEDLSVGPTFRVKRLCVNPGGQLSLQYHHHRSEHWVVVSGEGEVTRNEEVLTLGPNESILIPQGAHHRLRNRGDEPLELIEVQFGSYVGEDDIVRLEDVYGRIRPA